MHPDYRRSAAGLLLARHLGREVDQRVRDRAARVAAKGWEAEPSPFVVATTSSGLLRQDPTAFRVWSEGMDERLARRLLPTGIVREGDPVGDTALVLLALQAAYRTY